MSSSSRFDKRQQRAMDDEAHRLCRSPRNIVANSRFVAVLRRSLEKRLVDSLIFASPLVSFSSLLTFWAYLVSLWWNLTFHLLCFGYCFQFASIKDDGGGQNRLRAIKEEKSADPSLLSDRSLVSTTSTTTMGELNFVFQSGMFEEAVSVEGPEISIRDLRERAAKFINKYVSNCSR